MRLRLDAVKQLLEFDGFGNELLIIRLSGHNRYWVFERSRLGKDTRHASEAESTFWQSSILYLLVVGDLIAGFLEVGIGGLSFHKHVEEIFSGSLLMAGSD